MDNRHGGCHCARDQDMDDKEGISCYEGNAGLDRPTKIRRCGVLFSDEGYEDD